MPPSPADQIADDHAGEDGVGQRVGDEGEPAQQRRTRSTGPPSAPSSSSSTSARAMNGRRTARQELRDSTAPSGVGPRSRGRRAAPAPARRTWPAAARGSASPRSGRSRHWCRLSRQTSSQARWAMARSWVLTHDRRALRPCSAAHAVQQRVLADRVDAVERLVEQQQPRLRRRSPGPAAPAAAARRTACRTGRRARSARPDLLQRRRRRRPVGPAPAAQPADLPVAAHQHDLLDRDREVGVERVGLRHVGDVAPGPGGRAAQHLDPAARRPGPGRGSP